MIEKQAGQITDPVKKLKFLKIVLSEFQKPASSKTAEPVPTVVFKHTYIAASIFMGFLILSATILILTFASLKKAVKTETDPASDLNRDIFLPVIYPPDTRPDNRDGAYSRQIESRDIRIPETYPEYMDKLIWLVEKTEHSETYSNRLKIITIHTTSNTPRRYYRFLKDTPQLPSDMMISDKVKGIVYHASESDIYAFRPEMTESIKEYSKALVKYLSRKKAYNYFIDRFGQVYRVVREEDTAFHAGNSIWADKEAVYMDLNNAFLGICFEGKDFEVMAQPPDDSKNIQNLPNLKPMDSSSINEAQLISGKELTDWLRVKYSIPQGNCVPHCLVSINPYNHLIGYHLDLSKNFPFDQYALSNKYNEPIPAITEFGLTYDNYFLEIFNGKIWPGITYSEKILEKKAGEYNMSVDGYRKLLNNRFTSFFNWQRKKMGKPDRNEVH